MIFFWSDLNHDLNQIILIKQPWLLHNQNTHYCGKICYIMLLMHWATKEISPMTVLVQNGYLLRHILVSHPLIFTKFPFWHSICTMLFVIATAVCLFQANCSFFPINLCLWE